MSIPAIPPTIVRVLNRAPQARYVNVLAAWISVVAIIGAISCRDASVDQTPNIEGSNYMNYAGNPATFPNMFPLVDDSTVPTGADLNVPLEALADRTSWLHARLGNVVDGALIEFPYAGVNEWIAGTYDTRVTLDGWAAGGGGGGGSKGVNGSDTTYTHASSGGGGGAALRQTKTIDVTPGMTYEIVIGVGGSAGAGGTSATSGGNAGNGGDGGDTIFREKVTGTVLATFKGGKGGRRGLADFRNSGEGAFYVLPGGSPTEMGTSRLGGFRTDDTSFCFGPGFGGDGIANVIDGGPTSRSGASSLEGKVGGNGGAQGSNESNYPGGAGGGGGAAGPGGPGIAGRAGGNGSDSAPGSNAPVSTVDIAPSQGFGGGGGGAGGGGPTGGGNGSPGTAGSSAYLSLRSVL